MDKQTKIFIADNGDVTIGETDPVTFDDFVEPDSQIRSEHLVQDCRDTQKNMLGVDNTGDRKSHLHKLPYQNVEKVVFDSISRVSQYGFNKYGCYDSWQLQNDIDVYYGALLRHLMADLDGEVYDTESNLAHLDHAIWNLQAILWLREKHVLYRENQLEDNFVSNLEYELTEQEINDLIYGDSFEHTYSIDDLISKSEQDFMGNRTGELSD